MEIFVGSVSEFILNKPQKRQVAFFERKNNENANISISKLISEKFIIGIGIQFYHYLNMLRRIQRDLI
ncbi:unnamed protein product [Callosobruchus maculatus]|uniref:Uncharacterized protein n=1 Tax=Callosobruchus maculatus TaxID=64391 RepID=A0A653BLD3_CALMS|nr:unnamed protein product [Callosobruchus maculatus]